MFAFRVSGYADASVRRARGVRPLAFTAVHSRRLREALRLPMLCCWISARVAFASLRTSLIQIETNCSSSCIGGPPCWKRGGEFGQIDDNRWSAIRQGGVPRARNSLTWGFAGAFFSLRPACRKTARFAPCDHRLSCVCPNSGAFSQQPPSPMPAPLAPPPFPLHRPLPAAVDPYPSPSRLSLFCNVFPSRAHTPQPVAIL